jgi:hypothetical protein
MPKGNFPIKMANQTIYYQVAGEKIKFLVLDMQK